MQTYTVGDNLSHADAASAARLILQTLQHTVATFETDIPPPSTDWPPSVTSAAELLRSVARRRTRGGYTQTGTLKNTDSKIWSAFVEFAPWAYDATAWNSTADPIVSLTDEAHSIVIRVDDPQFAEITAALGDVPLHRLGR